jgi:hypothetical protein
LRADKATLFNSKSCWFFNSFIRLSALTLFSVVEALIALMASSFASSTLFISTPLSF